MSLQNTLSPFDEKRCYIDKTENTLGNKRMYTHSE